MLAGPLSIEVGAPGPSEEFRCSGLDGLQILTQVLDLLDQGSFLGVGNAALQRPSGKRVLGPVQVLFGY